LQFIFGSHRELKAPCALLEGQQNTKNLGNFWRAVINIFLTQVIEDKAVATVPHDILVSKLETQI